MHADRRLNPASWGLADVLRTEMIFERFPRRATNCAKRWCGGISPRRGSPGKAEPLTGAATAQWPCRRGSGVVLHVPAGNRHHDSWCSCGSPEKPRLSDESLHGLDRVAGNTAAGRSAAT